ncbi:MAG: copper-binding protein [Bdellovibrio sp.]|nr:copper-binding protein [Bdellovibrio sp.]
MAVLLVGQLVSSISEASAPRASAPQASAPRANYPLVKGVIRKVDLSSGRVSIKHEDISDPNMSGMTMSFVGQFEKLKSLVEGAVASDQLFNILVADVELPGTFGFYVIEVMREALKGRKIPMFIMSAHFSKSALEQLVRWRILGCIRKPLKVGDLENFILDRYIFLAETVLEYKKHNAQFRIDESELRKKAS